MNRRNKMGFVREETRGGEWIKAGSGYVCVYAPNHPAASGGYVYKHRLVVEDVLGRYLVPGENVHHRDGNPQNNDISNLELWSTSQPAGQRVQEKVSWAESILEEYGGFVLPAPRAALKRVGVDLDGTLAQSVWTPESPGREIGMPIWENVEKVNELATAGWRIWIYTARPDTDYESIEQWLLFWGIPFHGILTGKPLLVALFDDRVHNASEEDWLSIVGPAPSV
jgi:hypothetical protein